MRTTSKGRQRGCEKVRRLQQMLLLPERHTVSEDLPPRRWRKGCKLKAQNFQKMKLGAGNLLDSPRCMQSWTVVRRMPGETFCNCNEEFGKRAENLCCGSG